MKFGSIIFGITVTVTVALAAYSGYKTGKKSAINQIYRRGWIICISNDNDGKSDNTSKKEES